MLNRLLTAVRKFIFCYTITADSGSFLKLLVNTKRYRYGRDFGEDTPVLYHLLLNGTRKTVFLRTYCGDIEIFYEVFWKKVYSVPTHLAIRPLTVVDLGANTGMASLFFSAYYPNAKIYAVEADDNNMQVFLKNLSSEIGSSQVIAIRAAVFSKDVELFLQQREKAYNSSITHAKTEISVQGISMNTLMQKYALDKIDLLKIDIEGSEEAIFAENTEWMERVSVIVTEIHRPQYRSVCETFLRNRGFLINPLVNETRTSNLLWATRQS
ncbi:MAG TPA: FkbM family methyltransferase [Agriterribacter sp.]|nr:FkbM family methyltransferase [Agriterribacter sp.]